MKLEFNIKLDQAQRPYWDGRLTHEGQTMMEVTSKTFEWGNAQQYKDSYEMCTVRLFKEVLAMKHPLTVQHMLIDKQ